MMTTVEDLEQISMDEAYKVYQDRFADAGDFTFIFVGNFEVEAMKQLTKVYLGNLPSKGREETWRDVGADLVKGVIDTTFRRGEAPRARLEMVWHGDFDYNEPGARYDFYSMIEVLRIKLRESLREDKGGVYGVSLRGFVSKEPKEAYSITLSFNCAPEMLDELVDAAMRDIKLLKKEGKVEKEVQKVQETQRQSRIKALKENRFWLGQLATRYRNDIALEGILQENYEKSVDGLSAEAVQKSAQKHFNDKNVIKLVLRPGEQ